VRLHAFDTKSQAETFCATVQAKHPAWHMLCQHYGHLGFNQDQEEYLVQHWSERLGYWLYC